MPHKYFLCNENNDLNELSQLVAEQNGKRYGEKSFTLIRYPSLDNDIVIAETPDLGEGQLGAFARRPFFMGEVVTSYDGEVVFEKAPTETIRKKCRASKRNGDYMWIAPCDDQRNSLVIDARVKGSLGRFVNHVDQNPNVRIVEIDGKLYYVAARNITPGEEITTSYGDQYFDKKAISYQASHLSKLIDKTEIASLFCFDQISVNEEKQVSDQVQMLAPQKINDLYRDQSGNILFFGFPHKEKEKQHLQIETLSLHVGKKIKPSSNLKLIVSPIHLKNIKEKIFGMFAGQDIENRAVICEIKGSKALPRTKAPDEYVYVKDGKRYFYDSTCSESIFIHAADNPKNANVIIVNNTYVANQDIKSGCLLLCYFGPKHPFIYTPSTIQEVIMDFNQVQSSALILFQQGDSLISISPKPVLQWKLQGPRLDVKAMSDLKASLLKQPKADNDIVIDQSMFRAHDGVENLTIETPTWMLEPLATYACDSTSKTMINDVDKQRLMTAVPFVSIPKSDAEITTHTDRSAEKIEEHVEESGVSIPLELPQSIWDTSTKPDDSIDDFITFVETPPEVVNKVVNQTPSEHESPSEEVMTDDTMSEPSSDHPLMNEDEANIPESPGFTRGPISSKFFSNPKPPTPHTSHSSLSNSTEIPCSTDSSKNATPSINSTNHTPSTAFLPVTSPSSHIQTMETAIDVSQQSSAAQQVESYLVLKSYYHNLIGTVSKRNSMRFKHFNDYAQVVMMTANNGVTVEYVLVTHNEFLADLVSLHNMQKKRDFDVGLQFQLLLRSGQVLPYRFISTTTISEQPILSQQSTAGSSKHKNTSSETTLHKKPKS